MEHKTNRQYQIDKLDREIMTILMDDAKTPFTEIAKKLIVSPGTIHVRMKKLENLGIVKGSELVVDPAKLGYDLSAFIGVDLERGSIYEKVIKDFKEIPEVVEAYYTTGHFNIFVKIVCMNTRHLYDVLNHKIQDVEGVQRTETLICLEESIKRHINLEEV